MSPFIDNCTVDECGEPATHWIANRTGEAFCHTHTPPPTAAEWAPCLFCAWQGTDYVSHLESHTRAWRDEARLTEAKHRALVLSVAELAAALRAAATQLEAL